MVSLPSIHEMFPDYILPPPLAPRPSSSLSTASSSRASPPSSPSPRFFRSSQDEERKHTCACCRKRFNRPSSLRIHMNTHTGATPFPCPFPGCARAFNVNSNMRRHFRNHSSVAAIAPSYLEAPRPIAKGLDRLDEPLLGRFRTSAVRGGRGRE